VSATSGPTFVPANPQGIMAFATIGVIVDDDTVLPVNNAPTANAGSPITATAGNLVTLDGTGSTDDNGVAIGAGLKTFWIQREGPPVALSDPYAASPTFTPVGPGQYTFELTTADNKSLSAPSFVVVSVQPAASTPVAGGGRGG